MTEALSEYLRMVKEIHFTQIRRRVLEMVKRRRRKLESDDDNNDNNNKSTEDTPLTIVVDSTGLSTTRKGSYIEAIWRKQKRRFVKLHIVVDRKTGKEDSRLQSNFREDRGYEEVYAYGQRCGDKEEEKGCEGIRRWRLRLKEELQPP